MLGQRFFDGVVRRMLRRDLRRAFRRVVWVGETPELPDAPVVLYANHHNYYDGHLLWLVIDRLLDRKPLLWMADWKRFPFFAPAGALPFPPDDPKQRSATIRRTARRFHRRPDSALMYFPEGRLRPPEGGVQPFDTDALARLDRLLPAKHWWPVAIHVTWRGEARPTALLTGGTPHAAVRGDEPERLQRLLDPLTDAEAHPPAHILLEGTHGPAERWNFSFAAPFFERYL